MSTYLDLLRDKLGPVNERLAYLRRAFSIVWEASGGWTLGWLGLLVIQGILPAATVYLTKLVVDTFTAAVGDGLAWENLQPVVLPAVLMGVVLLLNQVLKSVLAWIRTAQSENIQDHIKAMIHEKAAEVDLAFFETPDAYDRMARASGEASSRSLSILNNFGGLLQNLITLFAVAGLLAQYGMWLPVLLLVSTLPALWVVLQHTLAEHEWWKRTTEDRRLADYFNYLLSMPNCAAEVRAFDLSDYFSTSYNAIRTKLRTEKLRLLRKKSIAQLGAGFSALFVTVGAIGWMAMRALQGLATLGDVALFYQAFSQGQGFMRALLSSAGNLYGDTRFLEHLFTFLEHSSEIESPPNPAPVRPVHQDIVFDSVSFQYPGTSEYALRDFDLEIPAGETVAIVGPNGAGKSTLTKLLNRFYDPTDGDILIDGIDLRELELKTHRERITMMFQHPLRYVATAAENIRMGDIYAPTDRERVKWAARGAGAQDIIQQLPDGYDTRLGKHYRGGVELSGGEWQRISLARAFYRKAPIVILDEPTSHMDSWAEAEWLDRFYELVREDTAIIITHRFTTAMRADRICVMRDGQVVESGTHESLLLQEGMYAASWRAQMRANRARNESLTKG